VRTAVVSTLWPVNDKVTALLVGRFYRELAAGPDDVALALHRAQIGCARLTPAGRVPYADPYSWAAFVVHGA
jgi:CHAT domain-containing protein